MEKPPVSIVTEMFPEEIRKSYFESFFNIMYYLALVPFRVQVDTKTGQYYLKSNPLQKIFCGIVYFGCFGGTIQYQWTNTSHLYGIKSDMSVLLRTIGLLCGTVITFLAAKVVWSGQQEITSFLRSSMVPSFPKQNMTLSQAKIYVICVTLLLYAVMIVSAIWLDPTLYKTTNDSNAWLLNLCDGNPIMDDIANILKYPLVLAYIQGYAVYTLPRSLLIVLFLQCQGLGIQFETFMQLHGNHLSVEMVMDEYDNLKKTMESVNSWAGGLLLFGVVWTVSFVPNIPAVIRDINAGNIGMWHPVFYCATMAAFLLVGCDMPSRVRATCKKWIAVKQRQHGLSQDEKLLLLAFTHEINDGDPMGLSCLFFALTHSFYATMISLLATYGVIVFQSQPKITLQS